MNTVKAVLAALCIVIGFFVAAAEEVFLFDALGWFVASIAISLLDVSSFNRKKENSS